MSDDESLVDKVRHGVDDLLGRRHQPDATEIETAELTSTTADSTGDDQNTAAGAARIEDTDTAR